MEGWVARNIVVIVCGVARGALQLLLLQERDSEGFSLHGGPVSADGRFNPTLQYRCEQGQLWTSLLAVSFQLCDHNPGDGGFCVVSGSHKPSSASTLQPHAS